MPGGWPRLLVLSKVALPSKILPDASHKRGQTRIISVECLYHVDIPRVVIIGKVSIWKTNRMLGSTRLC